MRPGLPLAAVLLLVVLAGTAAGLYAGARSHGVAPAGGGAARASLAPGARPAAFEEAVRALDLIRPPRDKRAVDFALPMPTGPTFRLGEHRGKPVMINFWATWCPPCLEEMPAMERLWRRHRDRGFVLVAVSLDADPKVVPTFLAAHGFTFPVALDTRMETADKYGVRVLPSSVFVDRDGSLAAMALGPRAWDNAASHALVDGLTR
jgi:peroxiredoxin